MYVIVVFTGTDYIHVIVISLMPSGTSSSHHGAKNEHYRHCVTLRRLIVTSLGEFLH